PHAPGPGRAPGIHRPREAQPQRVLAGGGPPVRGDRRPDRRLGREAPARDRRHPRPRLDLRSRRPGPHRDHRSLRRPGTSGGTSVMTDTYTRIANGPLRAAVKALGLPNPVPLRRRPDGDHLSEPVLVLGPGAGADSYAQLLLDN